MSYLIDVSTFAMIGTLVIVGIVLIYASWLIVGLRKSLAEVHTQIAELRGETPDTLSEYEAYVQEREASFDARISAMKEELAFKQARPQVADEHDDAVEMHPLVKNLPHDAVKNHEPFEEVAE